MFSMQVVSLLKVSEKPLDIKIHHQSNSSLPCLAQLPQVLSLPFLLLAFCRVPLEDISIMTSRC